nr:hypothetical protein [Tanacetum cinerariifolium]
TIPTTIPDTTSVIAPPTTETPIIAPTIPPSRNYTPASTNYSLASEAESDPSEDPASGHIPPLPAISPFLSSDDDTTDSDTLDTSPSPTHDTPFTEITASTHRAAFWPSHKRRRSPMTSVLALPFISRALSPIRADWIPPPKRVKDIGYLADVEVDPRETRVERVTHPGMQEDILEPAQEGAAEVTYETLGDLVQRFHDHTQAIPVHRIQTIEGVQREQGRRIVGVESAVTALTDRVAELERDNQRLRGTASVESQRVDRLQRGMSHVEDDPRETRVERVAHPAMPEDIPEPAQEGAVEVTYETLGDLVQRFHDHAHVISVHRIQTTEGIQREQGRRIIRVESEVTALTERVAELERDNQRLRGTASVES